MKIVERLVAVSLVFSALLMGAPARAAAITFDDLDPSGGDIALAGQSPYSGLTWSNFYAYTAAPGFDGFNNGIVSPTNAAYSGGELFGTSVTPIIGSISSAFLFDFESLSLGAGYYDGLVVTVRGLRNGVLLYSRGVTVDTSGALHMGFDFDGIDQLLFEASVTGTTSDPFSCGTFNCTQFTIDDLAVTISDIPSNRIPEPGSLILACAGALAMVRFRRLGRRAR